MKISKIRISNILGIDELEFSPGAYTELSGSNGSGKTSVLESIKAALSGGHDATLLRKGADKGEVVLVLDDGTEISKRVTATGSDTKVKQDGKAISRAGEAIKRLTDLVSINPVEFLTAAKKDRVQIMLEAMPIQVDTGYLSEISGTSVDAGLSDAGLAAIEAVRKSVFDERTITNRLAKEKRATITQLQQAMPEAPAGVTGCEDELRQQVADATAAKDAELERVRDKLVSIKEANQKQIDEIRASAQAQIDAIMTEQAATEAKAAAKREHVIQRHIDTTTPINQALELIRNNRENVAKREQAIATIDQMEAEATTLEAQAETQTQALADIDSYKADLLASLPIPGVEVRDGEIFRDGVQFDRLNTAQQVEIAVEIAKLRAGELGVTCCDGLELLDEQRYAAFKTAAMKSGLQLFVTRVGDGDFSLSTSGEQSAPAAVAKPASKPKKAAPAATAPAVKAAPAAPVDDFDF